MSISSKAVTQLSCSFASNSLYYTFAVANTLLSSQSCNIYPYVFTRIKVGQPLHKPIINYSLLIHMPLAQLCAASQLTV